MSPEHTQNDESTEFVAHVDGTPREAKAHRKGAEDIELEASFSGEALDKAEGNEMDAAESPDAKIAALEEKLLLSLAEFDNYRKRSSRLLEDQVRSATDRLFHEFLEIKDNLERALAAAAEGSGSESLVKGVEMIHSQMANMLVKYNIHPIESIGKPFDATRHEAMLQVASDAHPEGVVVHEITRGYTRDDRVIRHSRVGVSSGRATQSKEN